MRNNFIKNQFSNIAIVIPTYNALVKQKYFEQNLAIISKLNIGALLVIDSSSTDNTVEIAQNSGAMIYVINKCDFNHGATRNLALSILVGIHITHILYMTQDAILRSEEDLFSLYRFAVDNNLSGCYARQIPHRDTNVLAKHLRIFNYGNTSYAINYADKNKYGMKAIFNSNSCCIYEYDKLLELGGFESNTILSEDSLLFATLLRSGYKVGYSSNSVCIHSHNYNIWQDFKRYFDIGVFQIINLATIGEFGYIKDTGKRYISSELIYVAKQNIFMLPISCLHILSKILGFIAGRNYRKFSVKFCRQISMNKNWWSKYYI